MFLALRITMVTKCHLGNYIYKQYNLSDINYCKRDVCDYNHHTSGKLVHTGILDVAYFVTEQKINRLYPICRLQIDWCSSPYSATDRLNRLKL